MEITPPKKKLSLFWLGFFALGLLLIAFLFQLVGPNPAIRFAKDTTYLTDDIESDGFPNYARHAIEQAREGVTLANNAAVLIARATWPVGLKPHQYQAYCDAMGMQKIPSDTGALVDVASIEMNNEIEAWLIGRYRKTHEDETQDMRLCADDVGDNWPEVYFDEMPGNVFDMEAFAYERPFTSEQFPPLAKWAKENQVPMDQIVAASERSHYFSMPVEFLEDQSTSVIAMLGLHHGSTLRKLARALTVRAMWHAGEGRHLEAWKDLKSAHSIIVLVYKDGFLMDQLVAIAVNSIACRATQSLLLQHNIPESELRAMLADLEQLPEVPLLDATISNYERLLYLDLVAAISNDEFDGRQLFDGDYEDLLGLMLASKIDWNHVLREINLWSDRLASVAGLKKYADRREALVQIEQELSQLGIENSRTLAVSGVFSSRARAQAIADAIVQIKLDALISTFGARDRAQAQLDLTRITAHLGLHRARHGVYPSSLDALARSSELPLDTFTERPYVYKQRPEGFLLYSLGPNSVDDGGSSIGGSIVKGERRWSGEYDFEIGWEDADIVVLAPPLSFEVLDLKKSEVPTDPWPGFVVEE